MRRFRDSNEKEEKVKKWVVQTNPNLKKLIYQLRLNELELLIGRKGVTKKTN
jgi:hypothetical protein